MSYQFSSQEKANAYVRKYDDASATYKIAGINGEQVSADNFHTAMAGLLHVVGKDNDAATGLGRTISQELEELP